MFTEAGGDGCTLMPTPRLISRGYRGYGSALNTLPSSVHRIENRLNLTICEPGPPVVASVRPTAARAH